MTEQSGVKNQPGKKKKNVKKKINKVAELLLTSVGVINTSKFIQGDKMH